MRYFIHGSQETPTLRQPLSDKLKITELAFSSIPTVSGTLVEPSK